MKITIIAAIGENNELGGAGKLLWHIPEDLQFFKEITYGETILMGRKTWESLPVHPLPGRQNIIVTRDQSYITEGARVYENIMDAYKDFTEIYVIGGGEIYKQTLQDADTLRITRVFGEYPEADTFFPSFEDRFSLFTVSDIYTSIEGIKYRFETWIRKR